MLLFLSSITPFLQSVSLKKLAKPQKNSIFVTKIMQKKDNIARVSMGTILVVLLVLLQFTTIFAAANCDRMCSMHSHAQKEVKSCCHRGALNVSMSSSQSCSVSANRVVEFPVVKTQLTRSSTSKVLISNTLYHLVASELPSQYGSFFNYSSVHLKCKETAIYLLDSVSLS